MVIKAGIKRLRVGTGRDCVARGVVAGLLAVSLGYVAWPFVGCGCLAVPGCRSASRAVVPDEAILAAARQALDALAREQQVDERTTVWHVDVTVAHGNVTLAGTSSSLLLKDEAVARLRGLAGVRRVADAVVLLPHPSLGDRTRAVVRVPVANLGDAPGQAEGEHTVTQAVLGMVVDLLEEDHGWYRVRMWDGYLGWMEGRTLVPGTPAAVDSFLGGRRVIVSVPLAPVRAAPSPDASEVLPANVVEGTELPWLDEKHGWVRVGLPGGGHGFLASDQVRVAPGHASAFARKGEAGHVLATATRYLGLPYVWGGTTAYGFDCSGLTQFAFRVNGWQLPRDADMQYRVGTPVAGREDLLPGDLVFFSTYEPGPSHVGIYIGSGRFIHCGSRGVAINSLDATDPEFSRYLSDHFLGGRRVLPSPR